MVTSPVGCDGSKAVQHSETRSENKLGIQRLYSANERVNQLGKKRHQNERCWFIQRSYSNCGGSEWALQLGPVRETTGKVNCQYCNAK